MYRLRYLFCNLVLTLSLVVVMTQTATAEALTNEVSIQDNDSVSTIDFAVGNQLFMPGLYWSQQRQGWGVNIVQVSQSDGTIQLVVVIYTYRKDGTAIWYLASGPITGTSWSATLQEYFWNGSAAVPTDIGTIQLDFTSFNTALMRYTINGESGVESLQFLAFDVPPTSDELTALWYPPSASGRGLTISTIGETIVVVAYFFDSQGNPLWSLGSARSQVALGAEAFLPVDIFTGYCLACATVNTSAVSAGALRLTFNSRSSARLVTENIPDWQTDVAIVPLSDVIQSSAAPNPSDDTSRIQPLLAVVPLISDDVTGQVTDQATEILNSALTTSSSGGPTVTTTPSTLDLENLPDSLLVNIDYGDNFVGPNGNAIKGVIDITLSDLVFEDTRIASIFDFSINKLRSNDETIADGNLSGALDLTEAQSNGFNGFLNLKFVDLLIAGNKLDGQIDNTFVGFELGVDNQGNSKGTVITNFRDVSFDDEQISGVTTITLSPEQTKLSANLNTTGGLIITELVIEELSDGSSRINTTGPSSINGQGFSINDLLVTDSSCIGEISFDDGELYRFSGDCEQPQHSTN